MRPPDVVVVGGGVVGCASARELARRGLGVVLIERHELAAGASGRNHGLLLTPPDPVLVPMARAGVPVYEEVAARALAPVRLDPGPVGVLIVCAEEAEREPARAEAEAVSASGVRVERVEPDGLPAVEPALAPGLLEGWLLEDGRRLDPSALTVAMAQEAREAGAEVIRHLPVRALLRRGDAIRGVVTDEGPVEGGVVVVAAGPWSPALLRPLGFDLPVMGARGWLVHLGSASEVLRGVVERAGWHLLPGEDAMSSVPAGEFVAGPPGPLLGSVLHATPDGTVLVGSSLQAALAREPEDPAAPRDILRRAVRLVPTLAELPVLASWWGIRPMTPDGVPIVGRAAEGLVVATGHGSQGVLLAGGTARLVAALILGEEPPFDPTPFAPGRFGL